MQISECVRLHMRYPVDQRVLLLCIFTTRLIGQGNAGGARGRRSFTALWVVLGRRRTSARRQKNGAGDANEISRDYIGGLMKLRGGKCYFVTEMRWCKCEAWLGTSAQEGDCLFLGVDSMSSQCAYSASGRMRRPPNCLPKDKYANMTCSRRFPGWRNNKWGGKHKVGIFSVGLDMSVDAFG